MLERLTSSWNDSPRYLRRKIVSLYTFLILLNILVWMLALWTFHDFPLLIGSAVLAYSFGLRHAVDADHIAAIDNVTRKLIQDGKKPIAVGFFFSLGHSTIVMILSLAIALTAGNIQQNMPQFKEVGGLIGTSVSAIFLLLIATLNIVILWDVFKTFQRIQNGGSFNDDSLNQLLNQRGLLGRFFRPLFKLIDQSWKMYPLGLLFGLGFDTATEVGLLGISAHQASSGLPIWSILIFPALFTSGMCLVDTTDSILMLGVYRWAYVKPIRKLYYNLTVTFVSVLVALLVGGLQVLSIIRDQFGLQGPFWDFIGEVGNNFGAIGYCIIGIFLVSWFVSTIVYRLKKYDEIEI